MFITPQSNRLRTFWRPSSLWGSGSLLCLAFWGGASTAWAQEAAVELPQSVSAFPESSPYRTLGDYDWNLVRLALQESGAAPEHEPSGSVICEVHYRAFDIFLPDEPFPLFFNKFHSTTRISTLAAAAPVQVGDDYSALLLEDVRTELKDPSVYSTIVVVPVASDEPNCVEVLVISRDLWSLRVGFEPRLSGGAIEYLALGVEETNFMGLNDTIGVNFILERGSWEIGPVWRTDWFMNRNLQISEEIRVIFDRERGGYEGLYNAFDLRRPLRSSWDKNAWYLTGYHRGGRGRVFGSSSIHRVEIDDPETGETWLVDERWNEMSLDVEAGYTRSFGIAFKNNLTFGAFMGLRNVSPAPMDDTIPESVLEIFREERLPRGERAAGLHTRWDFYQNAYTYLTNYASFEVAEPYRRGLKLYASLRYSEPGLGADVRFLQLEAGAGYLQPISYDSFVSVALLQGGRLDIDGVVDRRTEASLRLVLPTGWAGRFVARGWLRYNGNDHSNERFRLGATTSLRGYSGYAAEGPHAWVANLEWRSQPLEVLSIFVGGAAFLDVGSAWGDTHYETTYASVGVGIRFFIPQAMARPGSVDVGFPIGHGAWRRGMPAPMISLRFGQAFSPVENMSLEVLHQ